MATEARAATENLARPLPIITITKNHNRPSHSTKKLSCELQKRRNLLLLFATLLKSFIRYYINLIIYQCADNATNYRTFISGEYITIRCDICLYILKHEKGRYKNDSWVSVYDIFIAYNIFIRL